MTASSAYQPEINQCYHFGIQQKKISQRKTARNPRQREITIGLFCCSSSSSSLSSCSFIESCETQLNKRKKERRGVERQISKAKIINWTT